MSTYSPSLRVELITSGDQAGQWGNTTNDNFAYIFDAAIAGYQTVSVTSASQAFTYNNGPVSTAGLNQSVYAMLRLTTTTVAAFSVYAPPVSKQYIIWNNSGYAATIYNSTVIGNTTAAGTGVTIADGDRVLVWSNGTNFYTIKSDSITGIVPGANGGTGVNNSGKTITLGGNLTTAGAFNTTLTASGATNVTLPTTGTLATLLGAETLQNKTISGADNTLQNIDNASLTNSSITINGNSVALGGTTTVTAVNPNALTIGTGLSGTSYNGSAAVTVAIDSTVATLTGAQTLTNKTLTSPTLDSPTLTTPALGMPVSGNFSTGTFTWPTFNQNTTGTAAGLSSTLAVGSGGTGLTSYTSNGVLYASGTSTLANGSNFVFDGTNVGIGESSPSTYGKFVVGGTGSFTSSLVSTSSTTTDRPLFEIRKTRNNTTNQVNTVGAISFNGKWGSTAGEQGFINLVSTNVGGSTDVNVLSLGVKGISNGGGIGGQIQIGGSTMSINSGNGGEISIVNASITYDGSLHYFDGPVTMSSALPVGSGGTGETTYTNGQLLIGNTTGNTLTKATLTAGSGVSISNGNGSITISATGSGGTVTSVGATSPVASSGGNTPTISLATAYGDTLNPYASKTANNFLAAPNGAAGLPTFRAIVAADIPTLNQNTTGTAAGLSATLAVGSGGTGVTSFTSGALLKGNGSSALQVASAADIVGQIGATSVTNATNATTAATVSTTVASGATGTTQAAGDNSTKIATTAYVQTAAPGIRGQVFASNGTFTIPTGVTAVKITVVGGGGGSGGGFNNCCGSFIAGSGAGGGAAIKYLTGLTPGNTLAVTIGGAGSAGAVASNGGAGGTSQVASGTQSITTVSATGGGGGLATATTGAVGGIGSNGDLNIGGQGGHGFSGSPSPGQQGGSSIFGGGAGNPANNSTGIAGRAYGGGASGGGFNAPGAVGAAGVVLIEW